MIVLMSYNRQICFIADSKKSSCYSVSLYSPYLQFDLLAAQFNRLNLEINSCNSPTHRDWPTAGTSRSHTHQSPVPVHDTRDC